MFGCRIVKKCSLIEVDVTLSLCHFVTYYYLCISNLTSNSQKNENQANRHRQLQHRRAEQRTDSTTVHENPLTI